MESLFVRLEYAATALKGSSPCDRQPFELSYSEILALLQALNLSLAVKSIVTTR